MLERVSIIVVTIGIIALGYIGYQYFFDTDEPEEISVSQIAEAPEAVTMEQVAQRSSVDDCWVVIDDIVYDLAEFIAEHPGGETNVINTCGSDASEVFATEVGPHDEGNLQRLEQYVVGKLE